MDDPKDDKKHLEFTDAEINAAASIVKTCIEAIEAGEELQNEDEIVSLYRRLLDETANAKIRLKYHLPTIPLSVEQHDLLNPRQFC